MLQRELLDGSGSSYLKQDVSKSFSQSWVLVPHQSHCFHCPAGLEVLSECLLMYICSKKKKTCSWHLKSLILQCFTSFVIQQLTKRQIPNKNGPLVIVLRDRTFLIRLLRFCRLGKLFQFVNSQRSRLSLCPLGCCSSSPPPCRCCWIKVTVWQILSQFIIWDYVRKRLHLSKALMAPASSLNTT